MADRECYIEPKVFLPRVSRMLTATMTRMKVARRRKTQVVLQKHFIRFRFFSFFLLVGACWQNLIHRRIQSNV